MRDNYIDWTALNLFCNAVGMSEFQRAQFTFLEIS